MNEFGLTLYFSLATKIQKTTLFDPIERHFVNSTIALASFPMASAIEAMAVPYVVYMH